MVKILVTEVQSQTKTDYKSDFYPDLKPHF